MPLARRLDAMRTAGQRIGFVPTMGALHDGHLSLLQACRNENDVVVCSIFVNPRQFNNPTDYKLYPNSISKDLELLLQAGCDVLFLPSETEMYPPGYVTKQYNLGALETVWEGRYRPGHFQGVCQAVDRLFEIVNPDQVYFGQKDYQQCMVVKKLLQLTHREHIKLHIQPTKREANGLAMSSRNLRLSAEDRQAAAALFQTLTFLKSHTSQTPVSELEAAGAAQLQQAGFDVDYVGIANADNLAPAADARQKVVGLVAASLGGVRLIDNLPLN